MPVRWTVELVVKPVPDISVVMALCAWPDPSDMEGEPHAHLERALDSVIEAMQPTRRRVHVPTVEVIAAVDGAARRFYDRTCWRSVAREGETWGRVLRKRSTT